jgi:ATP-dependent exoDNAse (exonuclease V) alpha subunit
MPNAHFDVQVISRGGGRSAVASASYRSGTKMAAKTGGSSAVAAASYRSGEKLHDERVGKTFDYQRKEDVVHKEIITPDHAPDWAADRETLWNEVEAGEKRKDAQLARDIIAALPRELNHEQRTALVREFVQENFTSKGMIADVAIHEKQASDGGQNPHVHIMLTMREVNSEGFGKKNREWNDPKLVSAWRNSWETVTNRALEDAGREERVSLQSYAEQGIDKDPEKHMGYGAWNLEEKGIETDKGNENRQIHHGNNLRDIVKGLAPSEAEHEEPSESPNDLKHVSLTLRPEPDEPHSHARNLRQIGQDLSENSGAASEDSRDARQQHQEKLAGIFSNSIQRTLQASGEWIQRMGHRARAIRDWAVELGRDERSGRGTFEPSARWADRIQEREDSHER